MTYKNFFIDSYTVSSLIFGNNSLAVVTKSRQPILQHSLEKCIRETMRNYNPDLSWRKVII